MHGRAGSVHPASSARIRSRYAALCASGRARNESPKQQAQVHCLFSGSCGNNRRLSGTDKSDLSGMASRDCITFFTADCNESANAFNYWSRVATAASSWSIFSCSPLIFFCSKVRRSILICSAVVGGWLGGLDGASGASGADGSVAGGRIGGGIGEGGGGHRPYGKER